MANANIASDKIGIFPATRRGIDNPDSRLLVECNVVRLVNNLIDYDGYVIGENGGNIEFVIYGYYIIADISTITSLFSSATEIFAYIELASISSSSVMNFYELTGQDESGEFKGVTFTDTNPNPSHSNNNIKYISILKKTGDTWGINNDSKAKFGVDSFGIDRIDGGVIN